MTHRKLLATALALTLFGVVGCNPNPSGPSAPSTAPEGAVAPAPAEAQKNAMGKQVSGPAPAGRE